VGSRGAANLKDVRLTRRLGASLHHQIFLVMRDQILSGRFGAAELLPTEDDLTRLFGVSRITVRTALARLEASGLIRRRQGIGTFVKQRAPKPLRVGIREQRARLEQLSETTTLKLLEMDCGTVPADVQSWFRCKPDAQFVRVVRVRAASRPVLLYVTFIPEPIGCKFNRRDYARTPHHELIKRAGIRVASAEQIITAGLADPIVASRLKIEVGSPLLKLRTMFFEDRSRPVRYLEVLASPAMFELHMTFGPDDWRARLQQTDVGS
jgi:GntR family transcriptional regulator